MNKSIDNILIIGGPNAGKTHFGGQLYGRLNSRQFEYKIASNNRPTDLTIFEDVLTKLAEGKRAGHTESSANRTIQLKSEDNNGNSVIFSFPDYAGEQVKMIVDNRRVNDLWKEYIDTSNSWILFVRLDEIEVLEDLVNRGIPSPDEIQKRQSSTPPVKISDAAHFVELLQTLIYIKGVPSLRKISQPNLTIILSCWDLLEIKETAIPSQILKERLPFLWDFVSNNWDENSLSILGLSSTEKTLTDNPDDDYIDRTPIDFGFIINEKGKAEKDLTLSIPRFIGK
ncbi:hypothetical protein BTO15_11395 [Polaribacter sejongensis]|uniref:Double-GTPase 1 domain-containing protein n=1 Tax=Polaribacter sejongensis TaxID=985043 RepID=A0ABM6Q0K0_9FLAO|nr:hypothetical protein [Polaribacter sejongensis]AUC22654.1 hypothetical protein BTO15_11395 [Polaribacter sejongensis]